MIFRGVPTGDRTLSPNFQNFVSRSFKEGSQRKNRIERLKFSSRKIRTGIKVYYA